MGLSLEYWITLFEAIQWVSFNVYWRLRLIWVRFWAPILRIQVIWRCFPLLEDGQIEMAGSQFIYQDSLWLPIYNWSNISSAFTISFRECPSQFSLDSVRLLNYLSGFCMNAQSLHVICSGHWENYNYLIQMIADS